MLGVDGFWRRSAGWARNGTCKALRTLGARPGHFRIGFFCSGCFVFLAQHMLTRHDSLGGQREAWAHGRRNLDLDFER